MIFSLQIFSKILYIVWMLYVGILKFHVSSMKFETKNISYTGSCIFACFHVCYIQVFRNILYWFGVDKETIEFWTYITLTEPSGKNVRDITLIGD